MPLPVVLLHGILDAPSVWDGLAMRLAAAGLDVVAPDVPEREWSPRAAADDLVPLIEQTGLAHLVGHSRGATSAAWLAVDHPELVASLTLLCTPPQASEVFRAHFRRALARPDITPREREAFEYLSQIPEDDFPAAALRRWRGRALVVEAEDDPLYSPVGTMFWRAFLPHAEIRRVPGGHRFFADAAMEEWLADALARHVAAAEAQR